MGAAGAGIERLAAALGLAAGGAHALVELVEAARRPGARTVRAGAARAGAAWAGAAWAGAVWAGAVGRAHASGTDWPACT